VLGLLPQKGECPVYRKRSVKRACREA
jgi:hypothetical protein